MSFFWFELEYSKIWWYYWLLSSLDSKSWLIGYCNRFPLWKKDQNRTCSLRDSSQAMKQRERVRIAFDKLSKDNVCAISYSGDECRCRIEPRRRRRLGKAMLERESIDGDKREREMINLIFKAPTHCQRNPQKWRSRFCTEKSK